MLEIIILSVIQGITEFIPVSSSSHLIIVAHYLKFDNQNLAIDVSLHIGSFFAVIFYFRKDIYKLVQNKDLFLKILFASLPTLIIGYFLVKCNFIDKLRNIKIIGWTTIIFGILLFFSDKFNEKKNIEKSFNYKSALFIGLFQVLSLISGVSRSGISITAARFLNFNRVDSVKISFLLSIPTLAAVSFFGINNLITSNNLNLSILNITSIVISFIFSLITINYFLKFIKSFSLKIFVIYRILLGILILVLSYL